MENKDEKKKKNTNDEDSNVMRQKHLSPRPSTHSHSHSDSSSRLKCNICFELPEDPVVTRCGHLYCWACLHTWLQRGSNECPVCKAGVSASTVVPVYGSETDVCSSSQRAHCCSPSETADKPGKLNTHDAQKSHSIPERPRPERIPPPPSSTSSSSFSFSRQWPSWGMHSVQFGLFPFGVGVQFGSSDMRFTPRNATSRESLHCDRSQFISTILILLGFLVVFWCIFIDSFGYQHL